MLLNRIINYFTFPTTEPAIIEDASLTKEFIDEMTAKSNQSIRETAENISLVMIADLVLLETMGALHFVNHLFINDYYQHLFSDDLDHSKYGLMVKALEEFLPKDLLTISALTQKLLFVTGRSVADSQPELLIDASRLVEMYERSKTVCDAKLRSLVDETMIGLKIKMREMAEDGSLSFSNPSTYVRFPYSVSGSIDLVESNKAVGSFETILQESNRRIVVGKSNNNERVLVMLKLR